jgi:hypothetical protein
MATYRSAQGIAWGRVDRAVTPSVHEVGRDVHNNARRNLSRHVRTGRLIASHRFVADATSASSYIGTDHWRFIEYGTRAHEIRPRARRALAWSGGNHPVRRVRHPGTREYAPMRRALIERKR